MLSTTNSILIIVITEKTIFLLNVFLNLGLKDRTKNLFKEHPESHFFMDEFPVGSNGLQPKELKEFSDQLQEDTFLWIACQTQKSPPSEIIKQFGKYLCLL